MTNFKIVLEVGGGWVDASEERYESKAAADIALKELLSKLDPDEDAYFEVVPAGDELLLRGKREL